MKYKIQINKKNKEGGFTFVEMITVISIFAVMGSIVLFKYGEFSKRANLDNLAQNVALKVVEAQKSAISGVKTSGVTSGLAPSYGMYFTINSSGSANKKLVYFGDMPAGADLEGDKIYQTTGGTSALPCGTSYGSECLSVTSVTSGEYVSRICYSTSATVFTCPSSSNTAAQIVYKRPFPDATMSVCTASTCTGYSPSTGTWGSAVPTSNLMIELTSGQDTTLKRTIVSTALGQIRVYNGSAQSACTALGTGYTCP